MMAGRGGLTAARSLANNPGGRRAMATAFNRFRRRRRRRRDDADLPDEQDDEQRRRDFLAAGRHFGTPRPTSRQVGQFKQDQRHQEEAAKLTDRFRSLGKGLLAAGAGLAVWRVAMRDYTGAVGNAAERLRAFSPVVNEATARAQRAEVLRTVAESRAVGGSTAALLQAQAERADALQPFSSQATNFGNTVRTAVTDFQTSILTTLDKWGVDDAIGYLTTWLKIILRIKEDEKADAAGVNRPLKEFLEETAQGKFPRSLSPEELRDRQRRRRR